MPRAAISRVAITATPAGNPIPHAPALTAWPQAEADNAAMAAAVVVVVMAAATAAVAAGAVVAVAAVAGPSVAELTR